MTILKRLYCYRLSRWYYYGYFPECRRFVGLHWYHYSHIPRRNRSSAVEIQTGTLKDANESLKKRWEGAARRKEVE